MGTRDISRDYIFVQLVIRPFDFPPDGKFLPQLPFSVRHTLCHGNPFSLSLRGISQVLRSLRSNVELSPWEGKEQRDALIDKK